MGVCLWEYVFMALHYLGCGPQLGHSHVFAAFSLNVDTRARIATQQLFLLFNVAILRILVLVDYNLYLSENNAIVLS